MKKYFGIFTLLIIISLIFLLRPLDFTFNRNVSENRILIEYDIFGCGSTVIKVLDGGELIAAPFKDECPGIATDEVAFTADSNTPGNALDVYDPAMLRGIPYIITGEVTGVTNGAPDCCQVGAYAYNEFVPEFKADNWYYATYIPYIYDGNTTLIYLFSGILLISFTGLIICGILKVILAIRNKIHIKKS